MGEGSCFRGCRSTKIQLGSYYYLDDDIKAFEYFSKAAEKNHPGAYYYLSLCYGSGRGVPQNQKKGMDCLLKSADLQYGDAEYMVGKLYVGAGQNLNAMDYFSRAMKHGNTDAWEEIKKILPGIEKNFPDL